MSMKEYDVVVVGAGPSGSTVAKTCAEKGLKTLLIEEHIDIGLPQHCSGWLSGSPFTERLIKTIPENLILQKVSSWRIWSPSGKVICEIKDFGFGGWFVDRAGFDKFLAKEAVRAGSDIRVGTKFVDLIKSEEIITGIKVQIKGKIENIYSKLVIGADGSRSIPLGVAFKSDLPKLNKKPKVYYPGLQYEFINIKDMTPGVIEIFFGSIFDQIFKMAFVSPLAADNAYIGFGKHRDYENVKQLINTSHNGDRLFSFDGSLRCSPYTNRHDNTSLNLLSSKNERLKEQPGRYACSTEEIDHLVDIANEIEGVIGAQLAGAGLGGCATIVLKADVLDELLTRLKNNFYSPRELDFDVHVCSPVEGAGLFNLDYSQSVFP